MVSVATNVIKLVVSVAIVVYVEKIRGDAVPVKTDFMVKHVPAFVATIVNLQDVYRQQDFVPTVVWLGSMVQHVMLIVLTVLSVIRTLEHVRDV